MTAALKAVLVANDDHPVPDWMETKLAQEGIEFKLAICWTKEDLARYAGDADMVMLFSGRYLLTAENIEVLGSCGAIIRTGSGTDNVDVEAATRKGILVVNTPDVPTEPTADHTISLLFSVARQISLQDRLVRSGQWDFRLARSGRLFKSATLGLVGFGRIARAITRKLSGFEMNILSYDPYVDSRTMEQLGVRSVGLDELLSESDFVSVHCPLTKETYHLIGERELRLMRPEAVLINTSRGPVVDERALYRALREGWIARAGLDVTESEPIDPNCPLLELDNVVITPHTGGYADLYHPEAYWSATIEAAIALAHGRWPESVVNRSDVIPKWPLT